MAAILVVPGNNAVLRTVARQLAQRDDVLTLESANDALWQARRAAPSLIVTDVQLRDMSGAELAELAPNFAPDAQVIVCGTGTPEVAAQVAATGAVWLPLSGRGDDDLRVVYGALGVQPPAVPSIPPSTSDRPGDGQVPPEDAAAPQRAPVEAGESSGPAIAAAPANRAAPVPPHESAAPKPPSDESPAAAVQRANSGGFGRGDALVIQPAQHQQLGQLLGLVARETEAQCVLLVDQAGMILVQAGSLTGVIMDLVAPLLATTFSATNQLARQLGEQRARAAYIHEGERFDLYAFHLESRVSLLIIFDKRLNAGKLGTVWVYARRAMRQIQQILGR